MARESVSIGSRDEDFHGAERVKHQRLLLFRTAAAPPPHPHRRTSRERERTKLSSRGRSPHREFHSAWWFTQPRLSIAFSISNSCGIGRVYLLHKLWRKTHISSHRWFRNGLSRAEPIAVFTNARSPLLSIRPRFTIPSSIFAFSAKSRNFCISLGVLAALFNFVQLISSNVGKRTRVFL
mgnify:CR=1 FL=1